MWRKAGNSEQADEAASWRAFCVHRQAMCLRTTTPEPDDAAWDRAAKLHAEAARIRGVLGEESNQALSLNWQAYCLVRGDARRMTPTARALFARVAALYRGLGNEKGAVDAEKWIH